MQEIFDVLKSVSLTLFLFALSGRESVNGADYYVSPQGDDASAGVQSQPWQTLARVNRADLRPGDRILLEGGKVFSGNLELGRNYSRAGSQKLIVASYGNGRAVIDAGNGGAIVVSGCRNLLVRDLKCIGSGRKSGNTTSGIRLSDARDIELDHVEVEGFRSSGVEISGVDTARITHVFVHNNGFAGIASAGAPSRDLYIGYCLAENNPGDPTILDNHSGNGIVVGKVQNALIEYCEARYNGWDMPRKGNGPVGIWAWDADQVIIQFCISHHNRSTGTDGGGYDFDGGVTNSTLQYNYSHNNHGSGYLLCQYEGAPVFKNNIVRYNISQDDGITNHDSGIYVWVGDQGMESSEIYNNTIYNSKGAAVAFGVAKGYTGLLPRMNFRNNIFVSGEAQILGGSENGRFEGNIYWAMGDGGFLVDGYTDIQKWIAATGQEKLGSRVVGHYVDPLLRKDDPGLLTDPMHLSFLTPYQLLSGSPAIDTGLNLKELFGINPGDRDFYGSPLPQGSKLDVGACEYRVDSSHGR